MGKYAGHGGLGKLELCSRLNWKIGSVKNHQLLLNPGNFEWKQCLHGLNASPYGLLITRQ